MQLIGFLIALGAGIWVFNDAQKRSYSTLSALLWAIGTFLLLIVFLPLYLISRSRKEKNMDNSLKNEGIEKRFNEEENKEITNEDEDKAHD